MGKLASSPGVIFFRDFTASLTSYSAFAYKEVGQDMQAVKDRLKKERSMHLAYENVLLIDAFSKYFRNGETKTRFGNARTLLFG